MTSESSEIVASSTTMNVMTTTPRRNPGSRTRRALLTAVVVAVVASCAGGDDDDTTAATTAVPVAATSTTSEPAPTTEATQPPATPAPTAATAAPTTTTTTVPPSTTTTEPLAVQELILSTEGIGSARFGAEPEGVIAYVSSILGGNTADTGWVDPFTFADCQGTVARKVDWGVLSLLFTDLSVFASERRHFVGYEYGRVGEIGDEPVGLRTANGITLGSRVVDLLAEFPEAAVNPEEGANFPANYYVSDLFYGLLTGDSQDDIITVMFGGDGCGE